MAAAAKAARRNTTVHMSDFYLPNDPFQDPCIGRRTGVPLNIEARKDSLGFDNIDDYFPDSDPEEENIVPNVPSSDKDFVGRRTGLPLNINARKDSKGFDNVDDYFPDSATGQTDDPTAPDNQEKADLPEENSENTCKEPAEQETSDTPKGTGQSPNDTGTLTKPAASCETTPRITGPIKKRLSYSHGKTPIGPEPNQQKTSRGLQDDKGTELISKDVGKSDSEIDVVDVDDETPPEDKAAHPLIANKTREKAGIHEATSTKQKQNHKNVTDDDEEFIDVDGIENEETFLTIGNATQIAKSIATEKSPVSAEGESFVMSESFVLEGTRHKTMSPEYVSCSDSQGESNEVPAPRVKKSKIPVRKRSAVNTKQKATRGRRKKVEEPDNQELAGEGAVQNEANGDGGASNSIQGQRTSFRGRKQSTKQEATRERQKKVEELKSKETQVDDDVCIENDSNEVADDEQVDLSNSKQQESKPTNGRKQKNEEVKLVESEAVEVSNDDAKNQVKRRAKSLPGTKLQKRKSSRKEDQEAKRGKGRRSIANITQQQKKMPRGRKQKSNESEQKSNESVEGNDKDVNDDEEKEKPASAKIKVAKGVEANKKQKPGESVAEGKYQTEESELSGRKTRAQRKKEGNNKLNRKDGSREEGGIDEVGTVEDIVKNDSVTSEEKGQQKGDKAELSRRKTRAQRKKEADVKSNRIDDNGEEEGDTEVGVVDSNVEDVIETENMASEEKRQEEGKLIKRNTRGQRSDDVIESKNMASKEKEREAKLSGKQTRPQRKKEVVTKRRDGNKKEGEDDIEVGVANCKDDSVVENENVAWEEKAQEKEESDQDNTVIEKGKTSPNKTVQESINSSSNVSSNASSSSESKKNTGNAAGTRRRKRTRILPPYAARRRGNKANSSNTSVTVNSPDAATESELRTDAKKPRLEKASTKKGDTMDSRRGGSRTGRKSGGGNKSVAQRSKANDSEGTRGKSGSTMQNVDASSGDFDEVFEEDDANYSVEENGGVEGKSFEEVPSESLTPAAVSRPAKPAAELKSILKSDGSVGRTTAASRKRQMNRDKSHSGGSDADDESVLPAKQPNRKRLSTVSFASVPFVQASPQDPTPSVASKRSPVGGLSFLSKDSSFRSTDGTFTPGSALSVRSSVRSASDASSAGESYIDPEEEVTITNDAKQQEDEHSTRRSKRTIVPPLQYWKNERIDYERRKSGGWCIKGIIKNPTPTPKKRRKAKLNKKPAVRKEKHVSAADSSEEEFHDELEEFQEVINPTGIVLNPENNEDVDMDIFHVPGMLNFMNPSGKPAQEDDPLLVHKFISQPFFGGGEVILRPGAEKGRQFVRNDTMVFYVIKGRIMVTVHQSSVVLGTGSTFFVPQGNSYNIKNLKQSDAKLMFVQIKG